MYVHRYTIASLLVNLDCTGCNREHHGKVEKHRSPKNNDLTEQTGDVKEVEPQTTLNRQSCGSKSLDYICRPITFSVPSECIGAVFCTLFST